jgi:hypothetical protein
VNALAKPLICTEDSCQDATSHVEECECSCGGVDHGINHRARNQAARDAVAARIVRTGDVFLGAAAPDDDEWWTS